MKKPYIKRPKSQDARQPKDIPNLLGLQKILTTLYNIIFLSIRIIRIIIEFIKSFF